MTDISRNIRMDPFVGCHDKCLACSDHCQKPEFKGYKAEKEKIKENRRKYWSPVWNRVEGRYR